MNISVSTLWGWLLGCYVLLCARQPAHAQVIRVQPGQYQIDKVSRLIICNRIPPAISSRPARIRFDQEYAIPDTLAAFGIGQPYTLVRNDTLYTLFFTTFPILAVQTLDGTLPGDDDTPATMTLSDGQAISTNSPIDINIRGGVSRTFPKKSYKIEFVDNTANRESRDTSLLNLRDDSDWLLLAMYNEASRVNNVSAHALWLDMHQLYYTQQEPDARPGIRTRYIDAFLNGSYVGIYALTEVVDRKQLRLKKTRANGQARGELYKASDWTAATLFTGLPQDPGNDSVWAGFELKYPNTPGFWDTMKGLVASVTNTSDSVFRVQAPVRWQLNNLADYFIFLNLTRATDNRGKNLYIARYQENEPYFIVPWDLDGTWGFIWTGGFENITNDILSNGLFDRLLTTNAGASGKC